MFTDNQIINEMPKLKSYAMRLTKNKADAEDLLQNTIVRAYEKRHLYQEQNTLSSWASRVMYNIFVSQYRRRTKFESQYDPEPAIARQTANIDHDDQIMMKEVDSAMHELSTQHRDILVMICIQGMKYEEAAEVLDIPVGTVRSRLSRARSLLAEKLDQGHNGHGFSTMDHISLQESDIAA